MAIDHYSDQNATAEGKKVVTSSMNCEKNEEWFYTNNTIENGIENFVMHMEDINGKVDNGSEVVVRTRNKCENQSFIIRPLHFGRHKCEQQF